MILRAPVPSRCRCDPDAGLLPVTLHRTSVGVLHGGRWYAEKTFQLNTKGHPSSTMHVEKRRRS